MIFTKQQWHARIAITKSMHSCYAHDTTKTTNRAKDPCDCGRAGQPTRAKCCYKVPYGNGGNEDGIDPRAVLFRKFHPSLTECDKCPFCSQLAAVSKLSKIANHPCLLQVRPGGLSLVRQLLFNKKVNNKS